MRIHLINFLIIAFMTVGCTTYETYKVGERFTVTLDKSGMGGYVWQMKPDSLVMVINEYDSAYLNETTNLNEYNKIFELEAVKKGSTELKFVKKRLFEPDSLIPAENHFFKKIKIKN